MPNLLNIGHSGLTASKKSLEITGHNIANVNTDGFSRQRINQQTNDPITQNGLLMGTGVRLKSVTRIHDKFIEQRLNASLSDKNFHGGRTDQLSQVEEIFNEIDSEGLNQVLNRFFNSFRELSNQPENETIRSVVRDNAKLVVRDFKRIRESLDSSARSIDLKVETEVKNINQSVQRIANLNQKIAELEALHDETGDLRDQRDLAIRNISKSFEVHTYSDEKNRFVVMAKGVGTLVSGTTIQKLNTGKRSLEDSSNHMAGSVEVFFDNKPGHSISTKLKGGTLSAVLKVRNNEVRHLQESMDNIAYEFVNTVNAVHRRGYVNRSIKLDGNRTPASTDSIGPVTGINFFKTIHSKHNAAAEIVLSNDVKSNLSNIVTALSPNAPGDNRISIAISKLQHERIMEEGTSTVGESFLKKIGKIGLESGKAKLDYEQSEGLLAQAINIKERLTGVSLDEETANMVKFQHAYQASAKVMQTADSMFQTILSIKR